MLYISCVEMTFSSSLMKEPCEAFITSSSREVTPVVQIDQHPIGTGQPGPITQTLLEKYRAHLELNAETV